MAKKEMRDGTGTGDMHRDQDRAAVHRFQKPLFAYLVSGLDAENKWVRVLAAAMLGSLGDPGAARHLTSLVVDADPDLRAISRYALSMLNGDKGFPGYAVPDACEGCMIRVIAEEALAGRKKTGMDLQERAEQVPAIVGSTLPDLPVKR